MNFSKKDYKRAINYWCSCLYPMWEELQAAKKKIKMLEKELEECQKKK